MVNDKRILGISVTHPLIPNLQSPLGLGLLAGMLAIVAGIVLAYGGWLAGAALFLGGIGTFVVLQRIEIGFWAVIAVICLLPFGTIPIDIGLTPTLLDAALGAAMGVWALRLVTGRQHNIVAAPITLPLLLFIIIAIFSFIFGLSNGALTPNLIRHFAEMLLSVAFTLVVIDYCRDWQRLERLCKILLLAGGGAATLGIILWALPDSLANDILNSLQRVGYPGGWVVRYIEDNPERAERAIATSVDPNALGGLLLLMGAIITPQTLSKEPSLPKKWAILIAGAIFVCLILTFSRGSMVGLAAGLGFIALISYRRLIPAMALAGLLFLALPASRGYVSHFVAGIQGEDLATQMRFGEYQDAIELISRYPTFGVGFAGSPDIDLYLGVSSVYLLIGQQMGILGVVIFFTIIAVVFGYAYFNRYHFITRPHRHAIWLGLHAALAGGLVAGIFDHYFFNLDFHHAVTIFWLLVGLCVASTRLGDIPEQENDVNRQRNS